MGKPVKKVVAIKVLFFFFIFLSSTQQGKEKFDGWGINRNPIHRVDIQTQREDLIHPRFFSAECFSWSSMVFSVFNFLVVSYMYLYLKQISNHKLSYFFYT